MLINYLDYYVESKKQDCAQSNVRSLFGCLTSYQINADHRQAENDAYEQSDDFRLDNKRYQVFIALAAYHAHCCGLIGLYVVHKNADNCEHGWKTPAYYVKDVRIVLVKVRFLVVLIAASISGYV